MRDGFHRQAALVSICPVSGYSITSWSWICQPEKGLEWTGCIPHGGGTACNPSLKSPISISRDMSESRFSLPLNSVATEDTACIYCVRQ